MIIKTGVPIQAATKEASVKPVPPEVALAELLKKAVTGTHVCTTAPSQTSS